MSRIAIVGVEGSGKTVLMAALGDMFGQPSADALYLMPESQSSFSFMTQIPHKMKEEHQWPSATAIESMKHLKWTVRIGQRVLADMEMLDYPGELYRLAFGERKEEEIEPHREKVHEFLEHLVTADTLVVLLNLKDAMNVGASAKNNETVWLTRGIFDYAKKLPNIKKCLLLFTQADRYPAELNGPGGVQAAKEKYMPMLHVLYPDLECAAVAVATDESDAPAKEFSAAHGITEFMRWMVLHTEEGKKANAVVEECTAVAKKNDGSSANILRCNELLGKLAAIPTGLAKVIMPSGLDELRTTLNTLLEQAMEAEKKASILQQEAAKSKAVAELFASCEACRKLISEALDFISMNNEVYKYGDVLESLRKHDPTTWHKSDLATYQSHKTYHAQLNSFIEFMDSFMRGKKARVLAKTQTWEPLKLRFPDELCSRIMEKVREENASQEKGDLASLAFGTIVFVIIAIVAVSRINEQRNAQGVGSEDTLKAARQGDAQAQHNLGVMYDKGEGVPQDAQEAVKWYRKSAEQGDALAMCKIGVMYFQGQGVPQDFKSAMEWFRKAAEQGDALAMYNIGAMYFQGQGVPQDVQEAVKWFRKAAEKGHAKAQYTLGMMYREGHEVPQSYIIAMEWFRKAAEQGNAEAQYTLGMMYDEGQGVSQDFKTAAEWFRKAAEQGNAIAQGLLGLMYYQGQGVPQDGAEAVAWMDLAAETGLEVAKEKRAQFTLLLPSAKLEKGKLLAQKYRKRIEERIGNNQKKGGE